MNDNRFLKLDESARYLGVTTRWLRRNYPLLVQQGVTAYRVPQNAVKGRLMFERESLDKYIKNCQIRAGIIPL